MISHTSFGVLVALALTVYPSIGHAQTDQPIDFSNPAFIQNSGPTSIPIGHLQFCERVPGACIRNQQVVPAVTLTPILWKQLLAVNSHYNTTIIPMTDMEQFHVVNYWTYPDSGYGDCNDYQLAKQRDLIKDGWPASDLLMTVVLANGEGHAVLMVRTDRGDLILDNLTSEIRDWRDTPYQYLKRQSQVDPTQWVALIDARADMLVVAKR